MLRTTSRRGPRLPPLPWLAGAAGLLSLAVGCGDTDGATGSGGSGAGTSGTPGATSGVGGGGTVETLRPDAPPLPGQDECVVTITTDIPIGAARHLEVCTPIDYPTNPPSGGDHWGAWATFGTYDAPIPREMLVHDLEHGAVALLHDCTGCEAEAVAAFEEATSAHGADTLCLSYGIVARFVIAPDPELQHPIALAAWGATYVATCIDPESLKAFVEAHYGRGPEATCFPGTNPADVGCD